MLQTLVLSLCLIVAGLVSLYQAPRCDASSSSLIDLTLSGAITPTNNLTPLIQLARAYGGVEVINITIDSPGGDVDVTRAMIDEIEHAQRSGVKVNCHVTHQAASAAFLLYAVCSTRTALVTSSFMWHSIATTLKGNYNLLELRALLSYLETLQFWANLKIQQRLNLDPLLFQKLWMSEITLSGQELKTLAPHYLTILK